AQQQNLMAYLDLIQKWNKVYNLTALRDPKDMLTHHLLDSLSAVGPLQRHLQGVLSFDEQACTLLDVGSGGGLPGVVVAICCPSIRVTCVDAVSKKAAFVQQVAASLKLPNLKGVHARVESLAGPFDVVCSRAFASLPDFVNWSSGALADAGMLALPSFAQVFHVEHLQVPGLDAERCMIWMKKSPSSSS
ncbi:MAG: Ribosomal small subunit methyltransferase, partial [Pseudomonadota bacterium]